MVSHAVSHTLVTTAVNNKLDVRSAFRFCKTTSKISCAIFSFVHVLHHVALGTCTQCVLVVHLANRDQLLDRSDRASNTSFVCWKSIVRFYLCEIKVYFLQFQNLLSLYASQEAPFTVSSHRAISKQLRSAGSKEFVPSRYSALLKTNNEFSVRGW